MVWFDKKKKKPVLCGTQRGDNAQSISISFCNLNAQECARLARDIITDAEKKLNRENSMSQAKRRLARKIITGAEKKLWTK